VTKTAKTRLQHPLFSAGQAFLSQLTLFAEANHPETVAACTRGNLLVARKLE
jgi:hypothetical protein